jgi:hypothetical protein
MRPISISEPSRQLAGQYPPHDVLAKAMRAMSQAEREQVIRLWLSEGIPYAFQRLPMLYERIRDWLAAQIGVHPKMITLIGSARTGFSLAAGSSYGRPFGPQSDLDFSVVSGELFAAVASDFSRWKADVSAGTARPRNNTEAKYWEDNLNRIPRNISRGFINTHEIPAWLRYRTAQRITQTVYLLSQRVTISPDAPTIRRQKGISLRLYRDWNAFESQIALNLSKTFGSPPVNQSTVAAKRTGQGDPPSKSAS